MPLSDAMQADMPPLPPLAAISAARCRYCRCRHADDFRYSLRHFHFRAPPDFIAAAAATLSCRRPALIADFAEHAAEVADFEPLILLPLISMLMPALFSPLSFTLPPLLMPRHYATPILRAAIELITLMPLCRRCCRDVFAAITMSVSPTPPRCRHFEF